MEKRNPIGIDNFGELVDPKNNYLFVDRTALIKPIMTEGAKVIALHAFRRMGKSLFGSMLYHFFSPEVIGVSTRGIFNNLAINQSDPQWVEEYQGQYPVVMLSFKSVQGASLSNALDKIILLIKHAYREHRILLDSAILDLEDKEDFRTFLQGTPISQGVLETALKRLTELLFKHYGKKVWIIIDEYDTPLSSAYYHDYFPELLDFMKAFLGDALKSNEYLEKGVLLGIVRLTKESILSSLNNPKICTLLHPFEYHPYFGFTEAEVITLFTQTGLAHEIDHVRCWYNGYHIDGQSLYNPWSIINCLDNKGELRPYWVNTANDALLKDCLVNASDEVKAQFAQLVVQGKPVEGFINERIRFEDLKYDEDALWSLLYATGYLTSDSLKSVGIQYQGLLRIPNEEVRWLYLDVFKSWITQVFLGRNTILLKALIRNDIETFADLIQEYLLDYASVHHLKYEGCYHSLVLGLLYGLEQTHYVFSGTLESGLGYSDLLLVPKESRGEHQALLIEFKHLKKNETGEEALQKALAQIQQLNYTHAIKRFPYITSILKVGMAFAQKIVYWQSEEEKIIHGA